MSTLRVETMDTTLLPPPERWPFWVDVSARVSAPIAITSDHAADFQGRARLVALGGGVALTRFRYQSLAGRRTHRLIRQADPEVYQVALPLSGASAISARRRDTMLGSGDFTLVTQVRDFIDRHLGDPDLSPQAVADAHHVALRTLHRLFADEEETVAGTIRRRLERCRRDLTDPLLADRPVQAIAARWGFRDKAHFSRAFRAAYGTSPRAYREGRRAGTGPAPSE
ncbi:helix-turn-helix domain-containing protein [Micromonospora sp. NPDC048830]|uniref:helix-turn-helix domain-containing protein n=1 Tax=Micromonospora sp. NPDC048830 TaxID=3364257 RepID=UPI00371494EC